MRFSYLIIDYLHPTDNDVINLFEYFLNYFCVGVNHDIKTGINYILKMKPQLVLIRCGSKSTNFEDLFKVIEELFLYAIDIPYFILLSDSDIFSLKARRDFQIIYLSF